MFVRWLRIVITAALALQISGVGIAHADTPIFLSNSAEDRKQPANMNYRYEVIGLSVTVMKENTGVIIFKVLMGSSVSENSFLPYGTSTPVLQVKVLNRLTDYKDQNSDLILQAPLDTPYKRDIPIDAIASVYNDPKVGANSGRKDIAALCKPKTWMDSGATSNWVAFSIDRNCADINDQFWATTYIDSDKFASSFIFDSKYSPADPMYVDMRALPRPAKMLNQVVTFSAGPKTIDLEFPTSTISAISSQGIQPSFASLTPTVCSVIPAGNTASIKALSAGTCRIDTWAEGSTTVNPSPHIQASITINPIVMVSQNLSYYRPDNVIEGDPEFEINVSASSGLPVTLTSLDASVCYFKDPVNRPKLVTIFGPGTCRFNVAQSGSAKYYAASGVATFEVEAKPAPQPTTTKSSAPRPSTPAAPQAPQIFGGTASAANGSTSVQTQTKSDALAQKGQTTKTVKCRSNSNPSKIKTVPAPCPLGYKLIK